MKLKAFTLIEVLVVIVIIVILAVVSISYFLGFLTISKEAKQNSETLGAMIDRLSILSLKIFHMAIQTKRENVSEIHIQTCSNKLEALKIQRNDLCICFDELFYDCRHGSRYFKQYKQFKMYNDPNLNPQLYSEKSEFKQN